MNEPRGLRAADRMGKELDDLLNEDPAAVRAREICAFLSAIEPFQGRIVLFGAGNLGRQSLACLRSSQIEPLAFSDNKPELWYTTVDGVPVLPPAVAGRAYGKVAIFVVTIWSLGHRFAETREQLERFGCSAVIPVALLRWRYPATLLPYFCCDSPHKLYEQSEHVRSAFPLWFDEYSRAEYLAQLKWRGLGTYDDLHVPTAEESYFPDSIFSLSQNEFFIDCGAYDGDTIRAFLRRRQSSFQAIYALEPDLFNFQRLSAFQRTLDLRVADKIQLLRLAAGSRRGEVPFNMAGTEGSSVCSQADHSVECIRLDELLSEVNPTYVKMDIEGYEFEALTGAQELIRRSRPILAICLYHKQDDLWRIPLLVASLCPDYRLFLRPHEPDGWQLVCYAVPVERLDVQPRGEPN